MASGASTLQSPDAPRSDGRTARSARTRQAVVEALLALLDDGNLRPTAREIAERAGVSLRSVYVHFDDLEDLHAAAASHHARTVLATRATVDASRPLDERIADVARETARMLEATLAVRRAASLQEPFSPALAKSLSITRSVTRKELAHVFASELDALEPEVRARRLAALCVAASSHGWETLRLHYELSSADAHDVVADLMAAILGGTR